MHPLTVLSEDELLFRQEIAKFAKQSIGPKVRNMDRDEALDGDLISQCFEMGLMGIEVPENYGGAGGSFFLSILAIEELAKVDPSLSVFVDVQNTLVNNIIMRWGNKAQQAEFFPQLAQNKVGCFCLTEADSGSDAFSLKTKATREKEGWCIQGKKIFITNAKEAGVFIVFANVDQSLGYKGITAFVINKETKGLTIGKKESKLGIRASSTCEVIFDEVYVPDKNIVGELGKGYKVAIETLNEGRIGIAAQMLGLAEGALDCAYRYARQRSQFGKPINQFQGIQFQLAHMSAEVESAKLMVYNAARLKDKKLAFFKEAAMAKYLASQIAERVASQVVEIYGGYGFTTEFPAEKYYRDVKIGKIYEGTSNLQLQTIFKFVEAQR